MAEYTIDKIEYDNNVYKLQDADALREQYSVDNGGYLSLTPYVSSAGASFGIQAQGSSNSMGIQVTHNRISFTDVQGEVTLIQIDPYNSTHQSVMIDGLQIPTTDYQAANKKYVDDSIGAISIPTKVSDLTNDSGFVTTDEKVKYTDANKLNGARPLLFGQNMVSTGDSRTETVYASNRLMWNDYGPTLYIYNSSSSKYASFRHDQLLLANATTNYLGALNTAALTARRDYTLPDASGTIALTSDIPSYTATSPIDITSGVISHETSGVTAGTYVPSHPSKSYTYFPSITVDSTGHITSASNTGFSFECIGDTGGTPHFISETAYSRTVRSYLANSSYILTAGNTSKTLSISDIYGDGSYYFKVDDVICRDKTTYEQLICDWKTGTFTGYDNHGSLTLYVTIAEPYTHDILIDPIISYGNSNSM